MSIFLADGIGATLGDSLATETGFVGYGSVWYVSSVSGTDASGHGRNREDPFASIAFAVGFVSTDDVISVLPDHVEPAAAAVDISKSIVIIGEGSAGGIPTAKWSTTTTGADQYLTVSGNKVEIRNIKFTASNASTVARRISWDGTQGRLIGCYFEANGNDGEALLYVIGDNLIVSSTTFISTGTGTDERPAQAFSVAPVGPTLFRMDNCVISGGDSGWSSTRGAGYVQKGAGLTVRIEAMSLLLGSDLELTSGAAGYVSVPVATGGAQVRGV